MVYSSALFPGLWELLNWSVKLYIFFLMWKTEEFQFLCQFMHAKFDQSVRIVVFGLIIYTDIIELRYIYDYILTCTTMHLST